MTITPRHEWFRARVEECLHAIKQLNKKEDWKEYMRQSAALAHELNYAVKEWERYYDDHERNEKIKGNN